MSLVLEDQVKPLSKVEQKRLGELEEIIEVNLAGFVVTCMAFAEIQEKMLHREIALTVEEYARERFDLSRPRFFQLASAGRLLQYIGESTIVDSLGWQPKNEAQLRPLIPVFNKDPDKLADIIELVVKTAPDGNITAAHISQVVKKDAGAQIQKKITKTKKAVKKAAKISPEFLAAFEGMLEVINTENQSDWKTTDRLEATRHLQGLLAAIEG